MELIERKSLDCRHFSSDNQRGYSEPWRIVLGTQRQSEGGTAPDLPLKKAAKCLTLLQWMGGRAV